MSTFGTGTFGAGVIGGTVDTTATPDGIAVTVTLDGPTATFVYADSATPDGVNDAVALDAPSVTLAYTAAPDDIAVAVALDGPTATASSPLIGTLQDNFDVGTVPDSTLWPTTAGPTYVTLSGGRLSITTPDGLALYNVCQSAAIYTVTNSALVAQVSPGAPSGSMSQQTFMSVDRDDNNFISMSRNGSNLSYELKEAGTSTYGTIAAYNATTMAWWRIRHDGTSYRIGYSADGANWTEAAGITPSWNNTTTMRASLLVGKWDTSDAGITSTFDNINLAPDAAITLDDGINDTIALDAPTVAGAFDASPDGIAVPVTADAPDVTVDLAATPDDIAVTVALDAPSASTVTEYDASATPTGQAVAVALDAPTITTNFYVPPTPRPYGATAYGSGPYGKGTGGSGTEPVNLTATLADGLALPVTQGVPGSSAVDDPPPPPATTGYGSGVYGAHSYGTASAFIYPDGIAVALTLDPAATDGAAVAGYGAGDYGEGIYGTSEAIPPPPTPGDGTYGAGDYGAGPYIGTSTDDGPTDPPVEPPVTPPIGGGEDPPGGYIYPGFAPLLPVHILGIGPWNSGAWRGAPNQGVKAGDYLSVPHVALPDAQSKSFTLRLGSGGEARSDHEFGRRDAILIDQMTTDLWWRRKDPHTRRVEAIGRYNADKVDISSTDTGIRLSVSWVDYQSLLEDRIVMQYLHPETVPPTTSWNTGTTVNNILAFAVPANMGLDLSAIAGAGRVYLDVTKEPFEIPLGTTLSEVMTNLQAVSKTPWEWWVDMPADSTARPKLMLKSGQRGRDGGVTLFDIDGSRGPIASWTMQAAGDKYANALYFHDDEGGVVEVIDSEIALYGQRDATDSDASLKGGIAARIEAAAKLKLAELTDRRPTWTLALRDGYWEGRSHIDVGDWITVHVRLGDDTTTGKYRVTEINVEADPSGRETVSITVGTPRPARDPRSRQSTVARLVRKLKNFERQAH